MKQDYITYQSQSKRYKIMRVNVGPGEIEAAEKHTKILAEHEVLQYSKLKIQKGGIT